MYNSSHTIQAERNCWTCIYKALEEGAWEDLLQNDIESKSFMKPKEHLVNCYYKLNDQDKEKMRLFKIEMIAKMNNKKQKKKTEDLGKKGGHPKIIEVDKW